MDIIKEEFLTIIKDEMEDDEFNLNAGNTSNNFPGQTVDFIKQEINDINEENSSSINIDTVFVDCKMETDVGDEVMKNEGNTYDCQQCDYKATKISNLTQHVKSIHEGNTYDCKQCDYKASNRSSLSQHVKYIHEGITYDCELCDYKATMKDNLTQHVKSIHTYDCKLCDFKTSLKDNLAFRTLQYHVKTNHMGHSSQDGLFHATMSSSKS